MPGVNTGSEAIKNTINNLHNAVASMDATKNDLKLKYQVASSQWKDQKAKELGALVQECVSTLNKSMKELLAAEKYLCTILKSVQAYEDTIIGATSGGGRPRTRHLSRAEFQTRLESARRDNEAILDGYRQSLNNRGVPNCRWLNQRLANELNLMNQQSERDLAYASDMTNGVRPERVYPDYGDFSQLYDQIETEFRTYCAQSTNPNYQDGITNEWSVNCQRCVPAYEMRRRGIEAVALPCTNGYDYLSQYPYAVWENPSVLPCTSGNDQQDIESMMEIWGDGSRAQVVVMWDEYYGHTFIAEQINGVTHYIDPQSGNENYDSWMDSAVPYATTFCRIDTLEPSQSFISYYLEDN